MMGDFPHLKQSRVGEIDLDEVSLLS
jgi:hypothetical protein